MIYEAHRGVGTECPENTMPAFAAAAAQGYKYIELDPWFTKDGKCVILHDKTLNRTCRNADGSELENEVFINDITYEQARSYDAGLSKSVKFKGTKIPLFSEVLNVAKYWCVTVKLDNRFAGFSESEINRIFDEIEQSGAHIGFTVNSTEAAKKVIERFPGAELHYDGEVTEEKLIKLREIVGSNELYAWMCLDTPLTSWVTVPKAGDELCRTVKKYAKLGIWILSTERELMEAEKYHADMIETTGSLKPPAAAAIYDSHTHTRFSHDSECPIYMQAKSAHKLGAKGFAVTDHFDTEFCEERDFKTPIINSFNAAKKLKEESDLNVLSGVEMGEAFWNLPAADDMISSCNFDVIIGSVHAVRYKNFDAPYSAVDFGKFSRQELFEYLDTYFDDIKEMIERSNFDILAHSTCPLRYISGKYGIKVDLSEHMRKIDEILKMIIARGIALEVNTSCLGSGYDELMPNTEILKHYKDFGGYLVTLGSDAHISQRFAHSFDYAVNTLKGLGFNNLYYYEKRIARKYKAV